MSHVITSYEYEIQVIVIFAFPGVFEHL